MIYSTVLAFGDSLTFGARDPYGKCWPQYLYEQYLEETGHVLLYACEGLNGEIIASACKKAYTVLKNYPEAQDVVFFEGTNDSKPSIQTPIDEYSKCLGYISNLCRAMGRHLFLPTLPGLQGIVCPEYDTFSNCLIAGYNEVIRAIAGEDNNSLVELSNMKLFSDYYIDGVHHTTEGYRHIAKEILKVMLERRTITFEGGKKVCKKS